MAFRIVSRPTGNSVLTDRWIYLRRGGHPRVFVLPRWLQLAAVTGLICSLGSAAYHLRVYDAPEWSETPVDARAVEAEHAGAATHGAQSDVQGAFLAAESENDLLRQRVSTLEQDLANAEGRLRQAKNKLDDDRRALELSEVQRSALESRLRPLQDQLHRALAQLAASSHGSASRQKKGAGTPTSAPRPESRPDGIHDSERERGGLSALERIVAATGLEADALLERFRERAPAQGGPYIALRDVALPEFANDERREQLQAVVKALPLASPLAEYHLESGFGARRDPFNRHMVMHSGVDLSAPYRAPVFSTAPGIVLFANWYGSYGRVVEIDHGQGIVTRYAHLHRILVVRGETVGLHAEIGELGSTGRSTGPHLHYEVLVDGAPLDPQKFLEAETDVVSISTKK